MATIIKYALRAVANKAWLLLGYVALSFASHLVIPANAPQAIPSAAPLWWTISFVLALYTLPDTIIIKGAEYLNPIYQQVPRRPIYFLLCQFVVAWVLGALFIIGFTAFAGFGATLMPDGFSSLVALNILSFSLYITATGLVLMSLLVVLAVGKERRPKLTALVGVLLVAYLLLFHVGPGILALGELTLFPVVSLTEGFEDIVRDSVLHRPKAQAVEDIAQTTALLVLQLGVLAYFLGGKTDM